MTDFRLDLCKVDEDTLLALASQGISILTGNRRLTHVLRHHFDQATANDGKTVRPTPDILPWNSWLHRLWEEVLVSGILADEYGQLLTLQQEYVIWRGLIGADLDFRPMSKTASQVQEAWQLCHEWRLPLHESLFQYNEDSRLFWQWQSSFQRIQQKGWLSTTCLPDLLCQCFERGLLPAPDKLVLTGFDELLPQQLTLLETLIRAGCNVEWLQLQPKPSQVTQIACADRHQEALLMARWVRQKLADNPQAQIGVVVPELAAHREIIVHALDQILIPQVFHPGQPDQARPYNISFGKPLSAFPLITAALKLLNLFKPAISLQDGYPLFHSPFIAGWEQESSARTLLDARLRETGEPSTSIDTLHFYASQPNRRYTCVVLAKKLDALRSWLRICPRKAHPGQWARNFAHMLKLIGWLEGYRLSSEEYQVAEAWNAVLAEMAALDWVMDTLSVSEALSQLGQMARERIFQPQTGEAPIQVLGPLEAQGVQFDHLWMMGLHDGVWPHPPRPNPFIPLPLQRKHGLPHSSEQRELSVTRMLTQRIVTSADEVIVSYPRQEGDETLRASPLIKSYPSLAVDALSVSSIALWRDCVHHAAQLSEWPSDDAPPLLQITAGGGSRIFKLQAACPFRAFAELRLGATSLGELQIGLNAMARGTLLHLAMEKVWGKLDSHAQLTALPDDQLSTLVLEQVEMAVDELAPRYPQTFTRHFRSIEIERLHGQVLEWLVLEKKRPPFRVIEKERKYSVTVGKLGIQLKVDRIDEIADGRRLIIDYKTGKAESNRWFGNRPDEPQLPLYSLIAEEALAGITFAQIRAGNMVFQGIGVEEGIVPGMKSVEQLAQAREFGGWPQLRAHWQATLEALADSFCRGEAAVDPKQYPVTCASCTLQPLCRINELTVLDEADGDRAEGGANLDTNV
nr:PD-(D/E)XK nuclease family protein [Nitrosomonas nitrosa]